RASSIKRRSENIPDALASGECIVIFQRRAKRLWRRLRFRTRSRCLVCKHSTGNAYHYSLAAGSNLIVINQNRLTLEAYFRIEASLVSPARRAYVSEPGRADRSSPIILIRIARLRWRSCTTLDHIEGFSRLKSATRISNAKPGTVSILDCDILRSDSVSKRTAFTTAS